MGYTDFPFKGGNIMTRLFAGIVVAALLVSGLSAAHLADARPKKGSSPSVRRSEDSGWKTVATKKPGLCDVSYKVEGGGITLKVKNLSPDKQARVTYAVQCRVQNKSGKWEQYATYPAEGISMTIRKQDEVEKNIRTGGSAVKDLSVKVEVAEAN